MTTIWLPTVREIIIESAERARIDPLTLTAMMFWSARRSLNALFTAWSNRGVRSGLVTGLDTLSLTAGTADYALPADAFDLLDVVLRRSGKDTPVEPIAREEYLDIPDKSIRGRPNRYYLERLSVPTTPLKLWLWLVPENSTDTLVYNYLRLPSDVTEDMSVAPETARLWMDALMDELACRLYQKLGATVPNDEPEGPPNRYRFDPRFYKLLKDNAAESFATAEAADRQKADVRICMGWGRR